MKKITLEHLIAFLFRQKLINGTDAGWTKAQPSLEVLFLDACQDGFISTIYSLDRKIAKTYCQEEAKIYRHLYHCRVRAGNAYEFLGFSNPIAIKIAEKAQDANKEYEWIRDTLRLEVMNKILPIISGKMKKERQL